MTQPLLVTDTHPLAWYITGQFAKLPKRVKAVFDQAVEGYSAILIPSVVLWEFSLLIKAGIIRPTMPLKQYVQEHFFAKAISILDIESEDILRSHELNFSRDAFDTLIVAMALRVDCPLITKDSVIHESRPCELFWN